MKSSTYNHSPLWPVNGWVGIFSQFLCVKMGPGSGDQWEPGECWNSNVEGLGQLVMLFYFLNPVLPFKEWSLQTAPLNPMWSLQDLYWIFRLHVLGICRKSCSLACNMGRFIHASFLVLVVNKKKTFLRRVHINTVLQLAPLLTRRSHSAFLFLAKYLRSLCKGINYSCSRLWFIWELLAHLCKHSTFTSQTIFLHSTVEKRHQVMSIKLFSYLEVFWDLVHIFGDGHSFLCGCTLFIISFTQANYYYIL